MAGEWHEKKKNTNQDGTGRPCEEVKLWHLHTFTRRQSLLPPQKPTAPWGRGDAMAMCGKRVMLITERRLHGVELWLDDEGGLFSVVLMKWNILTCRHSQTAYLFLKLLVYQIVFGWTIKVCPSWNHKYIYWVKYLKIDRYKTLKTIDILFEVNRALNYRWGQI